MSKYFKGTNGLLYRVTPGGSVKKFKARTVSITRVKKTLTEAQKKALEQNSKSKKVKTNG